MELKEHEDLQRNRTLICHSSIPNNPDKVFQNKNVLKVGTFRKSEMDIV